MVEIIKADLGYPQTGAFLVEEISERIVEGMHLSRNYALQVTSPLLRRISACLSPAALNLVSREVNMGVTPLATSV